MAPLDFKHFTSAKYRPGEDDAVNYYAQKRKKQYHGNEGKEVKELSMKPDKKLPNLKVPAKGKKGISKFMRKKAIGQAKDDINASVQSADRKPEKYIKPDGKVGIRMVKTDKEVVKKEASVLKPTKPTDITKHARTLAKNDDDYNRNKKKYIDKARAKVFRMYPKEEVEEALNLQQRMKRSRLMKRLKTRIKIGRDRARRKMANKKTLEKRAMRQARQQIAKKLTRGIPKGELSFARKQEIEKRLDKPALKSRIQRIAKRIFKDVRKKEVQRKKG